MPSPQTAPWLQLPNFMAAAEAGARIGLSQHQLAQEKALKEQELAQQANEAAGRLGLGLSQLPIEQAKIQTGHEQAMAELALRKSRYNDLAGISDRRLDQGDERLTALENNRDTVNDLRRRGLDTADERLTALENNRDTVNDLRERGLDQSLDLGNRRLDLSAANQDRIDARVRPPSKPGTMDVEIPVTTPGKFWGQNTTMQKIKGVRIDDPLINRALGDTPGLGSNYVRRGTGATAVDALRHPRYTLPASPATNGIPATTNRTAMITPADLGVPSSPTIGIVRVKSPDGIPGYISAGNLEKAKQLGYTEAPEESTESTQDDNR